MEAAELLYVDIMHSLHSVRGCDNQTMTTMNLCMLSTIAASTQTDRHLIYKVQVPALHCLNQTSWLVHSRFLLLRIASLNNLLKPPTPTSL